MMMGMIGDQRIVTWDPATKTTDCVLSAGNLSATRSGVGSSQCITTTSHTTGKYYAEFAFTTINGAGASQGGVTLVPSTFTLGSGYMGSTATTWGAYSGNCDVFNNAGVLTNYGGSSQLLTGQTCCIAYDFDNDRIWWRRNNNAWNTGGDPAANTGGVDISSINGVAKFIGLDFEAANESYLANFGATAFTFSPPSVAFVNW